MANSRPHLKVRYFLLASAFSSFFCTSATLINDEVRISDESTNAHVALNLDQQFTEAADKVWQDYQDQQAFSVQPGKPHPMAGKLPDLSPQAIEAYRSKLSNWLTKLRAFPESKLSEQVRLNQAAFIVRLQNQLDQYEYHDHYRPLTSEGGFHTSIARFPSGTRFTNEQDVKNYLARLKALPTYFDQQIAWMRKGIESGNTVPKAVLKGYEQSIAALIVEDPTQSVFYSPFKNTKAEFQKHADTAKALIFSHVNAAYQTYYDFMVDEYRPKARDTIALSATNSGTEYYENRVRYYTTTNLTPEQIHKKGLAEVKRIRSEMAQVIKDVGFKGTFAEFLHFLRTDPQFYATTPKQLLMEASFISKKMDAQLPKLFKHLPRTPYGVAPVPAHIAPKYTTGRYLSANGPTDSGTYWVNTYALDRRPLYELEALSLHEAVPGHHLQISLASEMENTPPYRSYYLSAFGEGWGLYAEWLGLEVGFYQDPYSNFGRLTYEMWRALRLVVDTGMHIKGWTRAQAIQFMSENSALSEHNIRTEVDRYISWPAQALSYKIGEMVIRDLRRQAEQALGEAFDVREFHYHVLKNGSVTLKQLADQIEAYILHAQGK